MDNLFFLALWAYVCVGYGCAWGMHRYYGMYRTTRTLADYFSYLTALALWPIEVGLLLIETRYTLRDIARAKEIKGTSNGQSTTAPRQ